MSNDLTYDNVHTHSLTNDAQLKLPMSGGTDMNVFVTGSLSYIMYLYINNNAHMHTWSHCVCLFVCRCVSRCSVFAE